jgi:hypothetical protein
MRIISMKEIPGNTPKYVYTVHPAISLVTHRTC